MGKLKELLNESFESVAPMLLVVCWLAVWVSAYKVLDWLVRWKW